MTVIDPKYSQPTIELSTLEAVIANIGIGVLVCDSGGRVVLANDTALRILDMRSDGILAASVFEIVPSPLGAELRAAFRHLSRTRCDDKAFHEWTFGIGERTVKCTTHPIFSEDGRMGQAVLVLQDTTRDTEISRAKTEFTWMVAHELRTPLTSLKGSIGLILGNADGDTDERTCSLLSIAQTSCDRLIRLLDDMLDVAQSEAGTLRLRLDVVSLDKCLVCALESLRQQADDKGIRLILQANGDVPAVVADQDRIEQVIVNLLSNAIKFSPHSSSVTARLKRVRGRAQIRIMDECPSVPDSDRERIFEKFYRVNGIDSAERSTGLGLAICKAIIDQHGGRIYVRRRRLGGNTFVVDLPIPGGDELLRSAG